MRVVDKPHGAGYRGYAGYIRHLERILQVVIENGVDSRRAYTYVPVSTISSGYDSSFATALASGLGLRETYSVQTSRAGDSDTGEVLARLFDVRPHVVPRPRVEEASLEALAEFLASGMGAEDFAFSGFTGDLTGRILLTGITGGVWQMAFSPNDEARRQDCNGATMQEHRLARGFLHIPVPAIGIAHHPTMMRISTSEEMLPWRLHTHYDGPIPRRYLETHGVPREMFGQVKRATAILMFSHDSFGDQLRFRNHQLSDDTRERAITSAERLGTSPLGLAFRWATVRWSLQGRGLWYGLRVRSAGRRLVSKAPDRIRSVLETNVPPPLRGVAERFETARLLHKFNPPAISMMFLIGLSITRERYRPPASPANASCRQDSVAGSQETPWLTS